MKREWPPHRSFRVSDRIVPPSLPPFFSSCSDRTRARYPGLPPPLPLPLPLLPLPSTIASPHRLYGHHRFSPLPPQSFAPLYLSLPTYYIPVTIRPRRVGYLRHFSVLPPYPTRSLDFRHPPRSLPPAPLITPLALSFSLPLAPHASGSNARAR